MQNIKTPGVYIREVSKLPASVAPVSTAVPAFIGYTEKAERKGEDVSGIPVRITSMMDYAEVFGEAFDEHYGLTLTTQEGSTRFEITGTESPYLLHYAMQMFFTNGGGPCYVVSAGLYEENPDSNSIDPDDLTAGLEALETEDEPTLIVIPEAVMINANARRTLHDLMLMQCADLKDRFAVLDALVTEGDDPFEDAAVFRDEVGMGNLSYGAVYYPSLKTTIRRFFRERTVIITDNRGGAGSGPYHNYSMARLEEGSRFAVGKIIITNHANLSDGDNRDSFVVNGVTYTATEQFDIGSGNASTAENLRRALAENDINVERVSNILFISHSDEESDGTGFSLEYTNATGSVAANVTGSGTLSRVSAEKELYNDIKKAFDRRRVTLYPSSTMAGIYARVDRDRGVWKAPANVSISRVSEPALLVTDEDQENLNVDPNTGKSINAIRKFSGKGTMVWGARTLAGNDNEWRYVPVRRFFIFIEQSIKKATEPVVFEPNDANTWARVRGMIENFLTNLWRDGAIAGATPGDAFFVKVGLGETMSALDILEGRLIIEIGVAAVRPAEFIILRFMHKLQES
jgi:uncharacterized protein